MRKNTVFFIFLASLIALTAATIGCEKKADYKFLHDRSEIFAVEIVEVDEDNYTSQGEIGQNVVGTIDDIDAFLDDFTQLNCYSIYTDPVGIAGDAVVVKVIYTNGEYELIDSGGQARYTNNGKYRNYTGFRYFDNEQFDELISKYLSE